MNRRVGCRFLRTVGSIGACVALVAVAAGAASAAHRGGTRPKAATPFQVLMISPFSGPAAAFGNAYRPGVDSSLAFVNKTGGILGHPVTIKYLDDQSNPITGLTVLQNELASGTKYNLVITANSAFVQPLAPVLAQQDVLVLTAGSATVLFRGTPYRNLFSLAFNLYSQEQGVVRQMVKMHVKNVGVIAANNAAGIEASNYLVSVAQKEGITAHLVTAPPATPDATPQLQQLQADGAKALAVIGFSAIVPTALAARAKLGWTDPAFCDSGCAATNWGTVPASSLTNLYAEEMPWFVTGTKESRSADFRRFYAAVTKVSPTFPLGVVVPMIGYEDLLLARAAAEKARSIDGLKMAAALETIHTATGIKYWTGPLGLYDNKVVNGYDVPHVNHTVSTDFGFVKATPQANGMIAGPLIGR